MECDEPASLSASGAPDSPRKRKCAEIHEGERSRQPKGARTQATQANETHIYGKTIKRPASSPAEPGSMRCLADILAPPSSAEDLRDSVHYWACHKRWPAEHMDGLTTREAHDMVSGLENMAPAMRTLAPRAPSRAGAIQAGLSSDASGADSTVCDADSRNRDSPDRDPGSSPDSNRDLQTSEQIWEERHLFLDVTIGQEKINPQSLDLCKELLASTGYSVNFYHIFQDDRRQLNKALLECGAKSHIERSLTAALIPTASEEELASGLVNDTEGENKVPPTIYATVKYDHRWDDIIKLCDTSLKPDVAIGLVRDAFPEADLQTLRQCRSPNIPFSMATESFYFPFLICEARSAGECLSFAERQAMNGASLAVKSQVELHRMAGKLADVDGMVLAFSIVHDVEWCRIYAHFARTMAPIEEKQKENGVSKTTPILLQENGDKPSNIHKNDAMATSNDPKPKLRTLSINEVGYYRIRVTDFNIWKGNNRWICPDFVRAVYRIFFPRYLDRIRAVTSCVTEIENAKNSGAAKFTPATPPASNPSLQSASTKTSYKGEVQTMYRNQKAMAEQLAQTNAKLEAAELRHQAERKEDRERNARLYEQIQNLMDTVANQTDMTQKLQSKHLEH